MYSPDPNTALGVSGVVSYGPVTASTVTAQTLSQQIGQTQKALAGSGSSITAGIFGAD